jgi:hypothetical protein
MAMVILARAAKLGLLPAASRPLRIVVAAIVALALSWLVQFSLMQTSPLVQLSAGLAMFAVTIAAAVHLLPLIPERSHEVLGQIAGRYAPVFVRLVPRYWTHA